MSQAFGFDLSGVSLWSDGAGARAHGARPSGRVDREADGGDVDALAAPDHVAEALAEPAEPLPEEVRRRLEALTGADLSAVRLRTGGADPDVPGGPRIHDRAGISRDEQNVPDDVRDELRRQGRDEDLARMEAQARQGTEEDTALALT